MDKKYILQKSLPFIAYFNICVLWGTSNLVGKIGLSGLNITVLASIRFTITGAVLLLISIVGKMKFPKKLSDWKILINISLMMIFFTVGFIALGNKYADSGMVTMILATVPIFTAIIECFILKNYKISMKGAAGLIGGFIGIIIIVFYGSTSVKSDFFGILCALMGAVSWSVGSIYSKSKVIEGSIIAQTAAEDFFSVILFFIVGKLTGDFVITNITFKSLLPVFYLAIFDSLIGFVSYIYLLKKWEPSRVATYAYINPVVALILGALILNESITAGKILGMIIITISVILVQQDKSQEIKETGSKILSNS